MTKHYDGDDGDVRILMGAILEAFAGQSVEHYADGAERFLRGGAHPTLRRSLLGCAYTPMIDLLRYLEANGFTNYIASGGDRDFMRPVAEELYAIPAERVIGSSNALQWTDDEHGGSVVTRRRPTSSTMGRSSRCGSGAGSGGARSSPPATPMATYRCSGTRAGRRGRPCACSCCTTTREREFAYTGGAEQALEQAAAQGWTVASIKRDWTSVFRRLASMSAGVMAARLTSGWAPGPPGIRRYVPILRWLPITSRACCAST